MLLQSTRYTKGGSMLSSFYDIYIKTVVLISFEGTISIISTCWIFPFPLLRSRCNLGDLYGTGIDIEICGIWAFAVLPFGNA